MLQVASLKYFTQNSRIDINKVLISYNITSTPVGTSDKGEGLAPLGERALLTAGEKTLLSLNLLDLLLVHIIGESRTSVKAIEMTNGLGK